jgi:hypothetical protein
MHSISLSSSIPSITLPKITFSPSKKLSGAPVVI